MAQIRKPLVPAKLFKHFAMATVGLTAAVAMLADGSHREAKVDPAQAKAAAADLAKDVVTMARRESGRSSRESGGGDYYADTGAAFGAPMMRPPQSGGTITPQRTTQGGVREPVIGYSQAYLDSLSDEEYEALVEGLREAGMLDPDQRAAKLAELERDSAARSGKARRD